MLYSTMGGHIVHIMPNRPVKNHTTPHNADSVLFALGCVHMKGVEQCTSGYTSLVVTGAAEADEDIM